MFSVNIHRFRHVQPLAQSYNRIPFGLHSKVEEKLNELVELNINEPVSEPIPWVSPLVVVPKASGDIRLCIGIRKVNQAIVRERYPIPIN